MFEYINVHIQISNAYAVLLLGFEECLSEQKITYTNRVYTNPHNVKRPPPTVYPPSKIHNKNTSFSMGF